MTIRALPRPITLLRDTRAWLRRHQDALLFIVGSMGCAAVGAWLALGLGLAMGDALSRTYSALITLHSRHPHLAALGFIWTPLPSFAQLPLLLWPRLAWYGLSGNLVSAMMGGALLATLNGGLREVRVGWRWRLALLASFAINPMWLFYAANGMSEMPFLLFWTVATLAFMRWQNNGHWRQLVYASLATILMFGARYDALPYMVAFAGAIVLVLIWGARAIQPPRIEANLITYLVPALYAVGLWVYFNWQIMGDPLFFLQSSYSNTFLTRDMASRTPVLMLQASWFENVRYLVGQSLRLSPLFVALLPLTTLQAVRRRDLSIVGLLGLLLVVPLFQWWMYRSGSTFGFLRFYLSVQPAALLLALPLLQTAHDLPRRALLWGMLLGLLLGVWVSYTTMLTGNTNAITDVGVMPEETLFAQALTQPDRVIGYYREERHVGAQLAARFAREDVLIMADSQAERVLIFSGIPHRFILPSDYDFDVALDDPARYADYVLIAERDPGDPAFYVIQETYPELYEYGGSGLELERSWGKFRLYRSTERRP